jgi:hypothetical protein
MCKYVAPIDIQYARSEETRQLHRQGQATAEGESIVQGQGQEGSVRRDRETAKEGSSLLPSNTGLGFSPIAGRIPTRVLSGDAVNP